MNNNNINNNIRSVKYYFNIYIHENQIFYIQKNWKFYIIYIKIF